MVESSSPTFQRFDTFEQYHVHWKLDDGVLTLQSKRFRCNYQLWITFKIFSQKECWTQSLTLNPFVDLNTCITIRKGFLFWIVPLWFILLLKKFWPNISYAVLHRNLQLHSQMLQIWRIIHSSANNIHCWPFQWFSVLIQNTCDNQLELRNTEVLPFI